MFFALRVAVVVVACAGCRTRGEAVPPQVASDLERLGIQRREITVGSESMTYALIRPERVRHVLLVLPPSEARWEMVVVALQSWAVDAAAAGWAVVCPVAPKVKAPYWDPAEAPNQLFFVPESANAEGRAVEVGAGGRLVGPRTGSSAWLLCDAIPFGLSGCASAERKQRRMLRVM